MEFNDYAKQTATISSHRETRNFLRGLKGMDGHQRNEIWIRIWARTRWLVSGEKGADPHSWERRSIVILSLLTRTSQRTRRCMMVMQGHPKREVKPSGSFIYLFIQQTVIECQLCANTILGYFCEQNLQTSSASWHLHSLEVGYYTSHLQPRLRGCFVPWDKSWLGRFALGSWENTCQELR